MRLAFCVLVGLYAFVSSRRTRTSSGALGDEREWQSDNIVRFSKGEVKEAELGLLTLKTLLLGVHPLASTRNHAAQSRASRPRMYESYSAAFGSEQTDPNVWYIFPRFLPGCRQIPSEDSIHAKYIVGHGQEVVLGWKDLGPTSYPRDHAFWIAEQRLADEQCALQIAPDGTSAVLYALGTEPTGYRFRLSDPWSWLFPGQSVVMPHYGKISLISEYPEEAVFKLGDGYLLQQESQMMEKQFQQQGQPAY